LSGHERWPVGTALAPCVFDDGAQKRENARIVEPGGSQLTAGIAYGIVELPPRQGTSTTQRIDERATEAAASARRESSG